MRAFALYQSRWPWMILNGVIALILRFSLNSIALLADCITVVEDRPIMSVKYCLPVPVFHFWPKPMYPAARSLCDSWASCITRTAYYIHGTEWMKLIFAILYMSWAMLLTRCCEKEGFLANVNSCSCSLYVVVRPSVCLSLVCRLSVMFVHPARPIEIFRNVSAPFNTLVTWGHPGKILWRSSQGNPSVRGINQRVLEKCSDFGPFRGYT